MADHNNDGVSGGGGRRALQHSLLVQDGILFDVPLPESSPVEESAPSPAAVTAQPLGLSHSLPAYSNEGFAISNDVGFDEELVERRSLSGPAVTAADYWRREQRSFASDPDYGSVSRAPLPVPTISQGMVPYSGLHLLAGLDAVEVQQTVELVAVLSNVESENRYVVRSPRGGETLLVASECSSEAQRRCLGSARALALRVYDPSRQEALHLRRRLACGTGACGLLGCCYLQRLDVLLPPGRPLGCVRQAWSLLVPVLEVCDLAGGLLYRLEGPSPQPWACSLKEAVFKITSRDGLVELGCVSHMWKSSLSSHVTRIVFPSAELDVHHKALLLAAAFLLEYMYFESSQKKTILPCCCC